jgi:hypothetical protein
MSHDVRSIDDAWPNPQSASQGRVETYSGLLRGPEGRGRERLGGMPLSRVSGRVLHLPITRMVLTGG